MNEQNLIPTNKLTESERRELAKKGGIASGKARRERKTLREELLLLLSQDGRQERMSLSLIQQALDGNTKAFEVIRDTVGEKPTDKIEADVNNDVTINIELNDD